MKKKRLDADLAHRLHHLETMRQDFVANVSHELRTPLTVIHGYLETLIDINQNEEWQGPLDAMYHQTVRMQQLIEDLLFLSKLEASQPTEDLFKEVNIKSLIKCICRDGQALNKKKHHSFHLIIDENLLIYGIENELRSVFSNLIFNAINYTPEKGEITIKWYKHRNKAYFSVSDTGIGIESEHLSRITERFYRVDRARSRENGGTGLGLAIVKHVLIHHHAQLKIESVPGSGSTFTCIFPLSQS